MGRTGAALVIVGAVLALGGCGATANKADPPTKKIDPPRHTTAKPVAIVTVKPKRVHVVHCKCAWYDNGRARAARKHTSSNR